MEPARDDHGVGALMGATSWPLQRSCLERRDVLKGRIDRAVVEELSERDERDRLPQVRQRALEARCNSIARHLVAAE